MTIKELNEKHLELIRNPSGRSLIGKSHTRISIQFAIEVLEKCNKLLSLHRGKYLRDKIQELKQYLDEK